MKVLYLYTKSAPFSKHNKKREITYLNKFKDYNIDIYVVSPEKEVIDNIISIKPYKYNFIFLFELKKLFKEADVIYFRFVNLAPLIIISKLLDRNKKIIVGFRWQYSEFEKTHGNLLRALIKGIIEKISLNFADTITVPTNKLKKVVKNKLVNKNKKIIVVPNYVDVNLFNAKKDYSIKNNNVNIIAVGRLHPDKNYKLMIESIKELKKISNIKVNLTIVGKGKDLKMINELSNKYEIKINIIDFIENEKLPELLKQHDIFISTSKQEGHPKAVIEAMSCGLPVICTDVIGNNDVVIANKTGILVDPDKDLIAQQILKLIEEQQIREFLGKNARKFVVDNYNIDNVIKQEIKAIK